MTPVLKNRLIGCVIALLIFASDQWSKNFVTKTLGIDRVGGGQAEAMRAAGADIVVNDLVELLPA